MQLTKKKSRDMVRVCTVCVSCSVTPDSLQHHGLQPTRLLHPWDFPGKDTGVGCHCLLQRVHWSLSNKKPRLCSEECGIASSTCHLEALFTRCRFSFLPVSNQHKLRPKRNLFNLAKFNTITCTNSNIQ